jgi:putative transposase
MYDWRNMTPHEREETLALRKEWQRPWHTPPHRISSFGDAYLITAACYEHQAYIGLSASRLADFEAQLTEVLGRSCHVIQAWAILPNHYHVLVRTKQVLQSLKDLGLLHGRTSFRWNKEEGLRGRHVWHSAAETAIKSERHWLATINYIHHNPVKHQYVEKWQDWPFSSAANFLNSIGRQEVETLWKEYPINTYGQGWDD